MNLPPAITAFVTRRPVRVGMDLTPAIRNVRPFLDINPDEYPDPVRSGDFVNEGRAWGKARMPIVVMTSPNHYISEMGFGRVDDIEAPAPQITMPRGKQLAFKERVNIERQRAVAYGSLISLDARSYDYSLMGARNMVGVA